MRIPGRLSVTVQRVAVGAATVTATCESTKSSRIPQPQRQDVYLTVARVHASPVASNCVLGNLDAGHLRRPAWVPCKYDGKLTVTCLAPSPLFASITRRPRYYCAREQEHART